MFPTATADYLTVKETAEAWGVTKRWVSLCIAQGRVPGAAKLGSQWLVPRGAEKPPDRRRSGRPESGEKQPPESSLSADLLNILTATMAPLPGDCPDAALDTLQEPRLRLQYQAELAYLRGDFPRVAACFRQLGQDDGAKLRACSLTIAAAISLGDYALYRRIDAYLDSLIQANPGSIVEAVADSARNVAYVSAIVPGMVSPWLKEGDFSALPPQVRLDAAYKRAKYYQGLGQFEAMLAVAQTALGFCGEPQGGFLYAGLYLRVACAIACVGLGREAAAAGYLRAALAMALPHGFLTPFAESASAFGGLLEPLLKRDYPAHYPAVTAQWQRTFQNWIAFHNRFTQENITNILSLRQYEIAGMVARRMPRAKIAAQLGLSPGRLNNLIEEMYRTLHVTSREQLGKLIL